MLDKESQHKHEIAVEKNISSKVEEKYQENTAIILRRKWTVEC